MKFLNIKSVILILWLFWTNAVAAEAVVYTQDKPNIIVTADHPQFTIKLISNPTTGYSWFLREYRSSLLAPVSYQFKAADNKQLVGAPGYELWTFHVKPEAFKVPQQTLVFFNYTRPWERTSRVKQVVFRVSSIVTSTSHSQKSR